MINSDKLFPYHYIDIDTMNIISSYAGKDESLFEMDRDEYIVDLTNDMIDSLKKQKLKKKILMMMMMMMHYLNFFFLIFDAIVMDPY